MRNLLLLGLLVFQFLFSFQMPVGAAPTIPPKPTANIYVQDRAGVLTSRTRQTITAYSEALANKTKAQIVVLTVPSLEGSTPEDYGLAVLRGWEIGDARENNGVLLLVAVRDRKSRIEVGYGLEGSLPDGLTGRIQDEYMLPYFRQGNYDQGILNGYGVVLQTVLKGYGLTVSDLGVRREAGGQPEPRQESGLPFVTKVLIALGILAFLILDRILFGGAIFRALLYMFFFRGGGGRGGGFGGGRYGGGSGGGGGSSRDW